MAQSIRDVMTPNPVTLQASTPVVEAARTMRDEDIGDVIVLEDGHICGIVTDRDMVVRGLADGKDLQRLTLNEVCSHDLVTMGPDDTVEQAIELMRDRAIRRIPVVEDGRPVGVVSIGDLAVERDPQSALADISGAPPNT